MLFGLVCCFVASSNARAGLQNSCPLLLTILCFMAVRPLHSRTNRTICRERRGEAEHTVGLLKWGSPQRLATVGVLYPEQASSEGFLQFDGSSLSPDPHTASSAGISWPARHVSGRLAHVPGTQGPAAAMCSVRPTEAPGRSHDQGRAGLGTAGVAVVTDRH